MVLLLCHNLFGLPLFLIIEIVPLKNTKHSNIKKEDNILHIGGLTGYVTLILSKLSNYVYVIENENIELSMKDEC